MSPRRKTVPSQLPSSEANVISSYAEVARVLQADPPDPELRAQMLRAARDIETRISDALPLLSWRLGRLLTTKLECHLITDVLRPWCVQVAQAALNYRADEDDLELASAVFEAAAYPDRIDSALAAKSAVRLLNERMGTSGTIAVQAFVAITTSVPALLSVTCVLLARNPDQLLALQHDRERIPMTVEECLRLGGLPSVLYRRKDQHSYALDVAAANQDPAVFDRASAFDPAREPNPHLAFGKGAHYCAGAAVVRSLASAFLCQLVGQVSRIHLLAEPKCRGGAISCGADVPVRLDLVIDTAGLFS